MTQLGQILPLESTDGPGRGGRIYAVRSAYGLNFDVHADRGLDIGWASHAGQPLAWHSPRGFPVGSFAENEGYGWGRSFGGGLLTTCGMASIGLPSIDEGEAFGLHGRVSSIPAQEVICRATWESDDYVLEISGRVIETTLGGPTLELHRTIRTIVGLPAVEITDVVTNLGPGPSPIMMRHHINLGFPLVQPGDRIRANGSDPIARDRHRPEIDGWDGIDQVSPTHREEVYALCPELDNNQAQVILAAADSSPKVVIDWDGRTMPQLLVWKHQQHGMNVLALEPSTHGDHGRAEARQRGSLNEVNPGQSISFRTRIRCR